MAEVGSFAIIFCLIGPLERNNIARKAKSAYLSALFLYIYIIWT